MGTDATQQRAQYWQNKLAGLCVECASPLGEDEGVRCDQCVERLRIFRQRYLRTPKGRKAAREKERRKYQSDPNFAAKKREAMRARYERNKLAGLCTRCSQPALEDSLECARCKSGQPRRVLLKKPPPPRPKHEPLCHVDSARADLLVAMRFFDWEIAQDIFDRAGIERDKRDAAVHMLIRFVEYGFAERRKYDRHFYEYRLTAAGIAEADRIRKSGLKEAA